MLPSESYLVYSKDIKRREIFSKPFGAKEVSMYLRQNHRIH